MMIEGAIFDLQNRLETMTLEQAAALFISDYDIKMSIQEIIDDINKMIENFYINDVKMCIATANSRALTTYALKK